MKDKFIKFAFGLASFIFTAFAFLNTYEVVGNKDIAFADSLHKSSLQVPLSSLTADFTVKPGSAESADFNSAYGQLHSVEIPDLKIKVQLEEARKIGQNWYGRPSYGSYTSLNKDRNDTPVDYMIYMDMSWRTIPEGDQLETGMIAELHHSKGSKSTYRIASKQLLNQNQPLIVSKSEKRQIILFVNNHSMSSYFGYSLEQE